MNVKELKEQLNTLDENLEVLIRFAVSDKDELGYYLRPKVAEKHIGQVYIYADYDTTEEDCNFIGQKDLKKLWEESE